MSNETINLPRTPTIEMIEALAGVISDMFGIDDCEDGFRAAYAAMIAVAPINHSQKEPTPFGWWRTPKDLPLQGMFLHYTPGQSEIDIQNALESGFTVECLYTHRPQVMTKFCECPPGTDRCITQGGHFPACTACKRQLKPSVSEAPSKLTWKEIVGLVNDVLGCEAHKWPVHDVGHEMTGINFNSLARIIDRVQHQAIKRDQ